ncbi:MAG: hypothetical protein JST74_09310 [Bacteroidetes bacterium]|nr:hypothetical protein [Bacteroidota bacterium]
MGKSVNRSSRAVSRFSSLSDYVKDRITNANWGILAIKEIGSVAAGQGGVDLLRRLQGLIKDSKEPFYRDSNYINIWSGGIKDGLGNLFGW